MGIKSNIAWCDASWNPIRGCTRVSSGCVNCYAESMAARFSGPGQPYEGLAQITPSGPRWTNEVRLVPEHLEDPIRWRKPRRIFVNSMSDLFHEKVPFEWIDRIFAVMALSPQHQFQQLTKRPQRALDYHRSKPVDRIAALIHNARYEKGTDTSFERAIRDRLRRLGMENREASRSRRSCGRWIPQRGKDQSLPKGEGRVSVSGWISACDRDNQQDTIYDRGSSSCLVSLEPTVNPGASYHQSQERREGRQHAGELGTCNIQRAANTRNPGSGSAASRRAWISASKNTPDGVGCSGNAPDEVGRHDGEGHRGDVHDDPEGNVGDLLSQDLEARLDWPLPNVHLGVSAEDQATFNARVPILLRCPAAVRWVSVEPMIGPVLPGVGRIERNPAFPRDEDAPELRILQPDWIVCGAESGPNRRPFDIGWAEDLFRMCRGFGIPFFMKQGSALRSGQQGDIPDWLWNIKEYPNDLA